MFILGSATLSVHCSRTELYTSPLRGGRSGRGVFFVFPWSVMWIPIYPSVKASDCRTYRIHPSIRPYIHFSHPQGSRLAYLTFYYLYVHLSIFVHTHCIRSLVPCLRVGIYPLRAIVSHQLAEIIPEPFHLTLPCLTLLYSTLLYSTLLRSDFV